jgi:hypothetical protein
MLNVNPKMIGRLNELEADLLARRERAHAEGWSGEIEGIDLTLSLLRAKRDATARLVRKSVVDPGPHTTLQPPAEGDAVIAGIAIPRRRRTCEAMGAALVYQTITPAPVLSARSAAFSMLASRS